jgi:hypothetical protein
MFSATVVAPAPPLSPVPYRLHCQLFVVEAAEHDYRQFFGVHVQPAKSVQAFTVGEREIQKDDVHPSLGELFKTGRKAVGA